jgi:hypothetical protein
MRESIFVGGPECSAVYLVFSLIYTQMSKITWIDRCTIHDAMLCMTRAPFMQKKTWARTGHDVHVCDAWWPWRVTGTNPWLTTSLIVC